MGHLIFQLSNLDDKKKVVDFWERYCPRGFNGDSEIYRITYDETNYSILDFSAFSTISSCEASCNIYDEIPPFINFPTDIQKEMIKRSSSKSPIPFVIKASTADDKGGFNWHKEPEG